MQEIAAKKDVTKPEQPSSSPSTAASSFRLTPDLSTDPRQVVFDADNAIVQATNEIEASKSALGLAERRMNRMQELFKTGQLPAREVDAVETDVERHRSALKKSQTEREAGVRRLQVAREFLDGQIKIAELELHQAESRLDLASNNEARALNLAKQNVIAKEQLDAAVAAREQAQIQVQRAKTILDLYKRPLPGRTSPAGDTGDVDRGARKPSGEDIPGTPGKVPSRSNRPGE
jgi:multidrug resistance efflux pump